MRKSRRPRLSDLLHDKGNGQGLFDDPEIRCGDFEAPALHERKVQGRACILLPHALDGHAVIRLQGLPCPPRNGVVRESRDELPGGVEIAEYPVSHAAKPQADVRRVGRAFEELFLDGNEVDCNGADDEYHAVPAPRSYSRDSIMGDILGDFPANRKVTYLPWRPAAASSR